MEQHSNNYKIMLRVKTYFSLSAFLVMLENAYKAGKITEEEYHELKEV